MVFVWFKNLSPPHLYATQAAFSPVESSLGTHLSLTFDNLRYSFIILCTTVHFSWTRLPISLTDLCWSICSMSHTHFMSFSLTTEGLLLCSTSPISSCPSPKLPYLWNTKALEHLHLSCVDEKGVCIWRSHPDVNAMFDHGMLLHSWCQCCSFLLMSWKHLFTLVDHCKLVYG